MSIHFDLTDMQLFINIGDSSSLTRGAEKSHLSAPAASIRIKNLEDAFGTRLLYRTHQGVTLTPAGEALKRHAHAMMAQAERVHTDMQQFERGARGLIRIMGNTTSMADVMPAVLGRFLPLHPDVDIEVRERLSHQIVKAIAEGAADLGVVGGRPPCENLQFLPCREDNLALIVPHGHPLDGRAEVAFSDTLDYCYVGLSEWSAIHSFLVHTAASVGRPFRFRAEVGNFDSVCRLVEANVGIGVIARSVADASALTRKISVIRLSDGWAARRLNVCMRSLDELEPFARELVDMFVEESAGGQRRGQPRAGGVNPAPGLRARGAGTPSWPPGAGTGRPGS
ncbi:MULTISPECIES: LysR substrate-binding domain-containing protein [unclassified Achromobacter]|uniref:LysR substrate-binding domain-containing protein n=1 Tax=unclassified Achromobacter TaxID=2626865 RepID=UPI0009E91D6B|nr:MULTISPECIES: LysR substrate-binding domain-containing protein [unclassified Achromobacter]